MDVSKFAWIVAAVGSAGSLLFLFPLDKTLGTSFVLGFILFGFSAKFWTKISPSMSLFVTWFIGTVAFHDIGVGRPRQMIAHGNYIPLPPSATSAFFIATILIGALGLFLTFIERQHEAIAKERISSAIHALLFFGGIFMFFASRG
jgi:hypothetical protein